MGFTPATGTEIKMGCVYEAFGLVPLPGANIGLNSTLGVNRQPPQAAGVTAISAGAETELSVDMGGLDTISGYCEVPSPSSTPSPTPTPISSQCASSTYDVILLLDQSGSISDAEFQIMSAATVDLVSKLSSYLSSGPTGFQFGVVSFSSSATQQQVLTNNQTSINTALATRVSNGSTRIDLGLQQAYSTSIGTNTRNANKKIILYTDGNPNTGTEAATVLTADTLVYSATTFAQIQSINAQIVNGICQPLLTPNPTSTPTNTPTPSSVLYYTLNGCTGQPLYDTTVTPILSSQRYVDPISGTFWTWDNAAGTSSPQHTVNGSLQLVSGQSSCP